MVLIEGISVVFQLDAVRSKYPGGLDGFVADRPNNTLCADDDLVRVGFMVPEDKDRFVALVEARGLTGLAGGAAVDFVVVRQRTGPASPCTWVEFGAVDWDGDPNQEVYVCRAAGSESRTLMTPTVWNYESSLYSELSYEVPNLPDNGLVFVRSEGSVDVYWDARGGGEVYVGRTAG